VYEGIQCISNGPAGSFCGGVCETSDDCPDDFDCQEVDGPTRQCVPSSGECACSSLAESVGASTECYVEDEGGNRCTSAIQCSEGTLTECLASAPTAESCDGEDNDCDGETDNELTAPSGDLQGGVCLGSVKECGGSEGWQEPNYALLAGYETVELACDGKDNDCDGTVDNGLDAPPADSQKGECVGAVKLCLGGSGWSEPNYGAIPTYETNETLCDGLDNDCDGEVDEVDAFAPSADNQSGVCVGAVKVCAGTEGWQDPDYSVISGYEADETLCDDKDNDCDDVVDEGYLPGGGTVYKDKDDTELGKSEACGLGGCQGGTVVCAADEVSLTCSTLQNVLPETCDGFDNDCNPNTPDGDVDPAVGIACDGDDLDQCKEGTTVCTGGIVSCPDTDDNDQDICDGLDNDCNPATPDGFGDPQLDVACDGDSDADLCKEGNMKCVSGALLCDDINDPDPDFCDGLDNDCNPDTPDGSADPQIGVACDGTDSDLCEEGTTICSGGIVACPDTGDNDQDICDGLDNDCNPATADGTQDPNIGKACDGNDTDFCDEGVQVCTNANMVCNDSNDVDVDICDGLDNDCNPDTPDGVHDTGVGVVCDGEDEDLCEEGTTICAAGLVTCPDTEDDDLDVCDTVDNDCNPATPDGYGDPQLGTPCDGNDADLCNEGVRICSAGALACDDPNDSDPDLCDTHDNDCNPATKDGQDDPSSGDNTCGDAANNPHTILKGGAPTNITGGFNSNTKSDFFYLKFAAAPAGTPFARSIDLDGSGYGMTVLTNCNGAVYGDCTGGTANAGQVTGWSVNYTYTAGVGCCTNNDSVPNNVTVRVFRTSISNTCADYTLTIANSW